MTSKHVKNGVECFSNGEFNKKKFAQIILSKKPLVRVKMKSLVGIIMMNGLF